jgi:hypothetical protein
MDRYGANPPIVLYDSSFAIIYMSRLPNSSSSWYGGDVFASSYGKHQWLISGMGSGNLGSVRGNHMALGSLEGTNFTDLSRFIPNNRLGILYAIAWNGSEWMVGGGYGFQGVLFAFDGSRFQDLTNRVSNALAGPFGPVTSLAWNGTDWLIGGFQSLTIYDGTIFIDLTNKLAEAVGKGFHAVNAISWDKQHHTWLLSGGWPKANVQRGSAWIASLSPNGVITNLSTLISCYLPSGSSSILSSSFEHGLWALGGYATKGNRIFPVLLVISLSDYTVSDFSQSLVDTSYVIWVRLTSYNAPS